MNNFGPLACNTFTAPLNCLFIIFQYPKVVLTRCHFFLKKELFAPWLCLMVYIEQTLTLF